MGKAIKVSDEVVKKLDSLRHSGQTYDGVLREMLVKQEKDNSKEDNKTR